MEYEVTFIMLAIAALVVGIIATYTHTLEIITPVALTALVFVVWHLHHNTAQDLSNQKMEMHDQRKLIKALSADAKLARNKLKQHILHFDQTLQVTQVEHAILLETLRNQRDAARAESTTARRLLRHGVLNRADFVQGFKGKAAKGSCYACKPSTNVAVSAAVLTDFVSRALAVTIAVTASSLDLSATPAAATAQSASTDIAVAAEPTFAAAPSPSAASTCTLSPLLPKSTAPAPTIASNQAQIGNQHSDKSIPVCQIAGPSTDKQASPLLAKSTVITAKATVSTAKPSLPPKSADLPAAAFSRIMPAETSVTAQPPSPKLVDTPAETSNHPATSVKMPEAAEVHDLISQESVASVPPQVPSLPVPTLAGPACTVKPAQSSTSVSPLFAQSTVSATKPSLETPFATSNCPVTPAKTPEAAEVHDPISHESVASVPLAVPSLPVPTPASPDLTTTSLPSVDANDHAAEEVALVISQPLAAEEPTPVIVSVPVPVPSVSTAATKHHSAAHGLAGPLKSSLSGDAGVINKWCIATASAIPLPPPDKEEADFFAAEQTSPAQKTVQATRVDAKAPVQPVGFQPIQRKRSYVVTKSPIIKRADQGLQEAKLNRQQLMPKRGKVEEQPKATPVPTEPKEKRAEVEAVVEQPAVEAKPLRRRKARIARLDDKSKMHIVEWVVKIRSGLNRAVNPVKKYRDIGAYFARTGNLSIDKVEADYQVLQDIGFVQSRFEVEELEPRVLKALPEYFLFEY